MQKFVVSAAVGVLGLRQVARAATCEQRDLPIEIWQPSESCDTAVREAIAERPLDAANLTEYQQDVLAPYIEPPTSENE